MNKRLKWAAALCLLILPGCGSADAVTDTGPPHGDKQCRYPSVGGGVFSGTQRQILFGSDPPFPVSQTYAFKQQYGQLVRAKISAPSLKISSFPVICGYSPQSSPRALPLLVCVEKDFEATRDVYVTHWTRDCVATQLEVIGYEPGRFVGRMSLTRID